jgi:hypothetical protein
VCLPINTARTASCRRSLTRTSINSPPPACLQVTTFRWPASLGGHEVSVCGSFSGWEPVPLHRATAGGDFVRSLALPPGPAYFKYLVDGDWICSPCEQVVANGKGYNNHRCARRGARCVPAILPLPAAPEPLVHGAPLLSFPCVPPLHLLTPFPTACLPACLLAPGPCPPLRRLIQATAAFTWSSAELGGQDVLLTGSFNSWGELLPMSPDPATGRHTLRCCLPQGHYQFQYFVDGQWLLCPAQPTSLTEQGRMVNRCGCGRQCLPACLPAGAALSVAHPALPLPACNACSQPPI